MNVKLFDLKALEATKEDLREMIETTEYGFPLLRHPLIHTMCSGSDAELEMHEKTLRMKLEAIEDHLYTMNPHFVWMFERPYRTKALMQFRDRLHPFSFWETAGRVWTDSESIWENRSDWRAILTEAHDPMPGTTIPAGWVMMDVEDRVMYDSVVRPVDEVTIFRGADISRERENGYGFSWTIDRAKAEWFARRFLVAGRSSKGRRLLKAVVPSSQIIATFVGRREAEVVVNPEWLETIESTDTIAEIAV